MTNQQSFIDKVIRDKQGHIALWQTPNLPLASWAVATVATKLITTGKTHQLLEIVAFGAIFTWAYLEIRSGINYFRRGLGLVVLALTIYSRLT